MIAHAHVITIGQQGAGVRVVLIPQLRDMDQAFQSLFDADEGAELDNIGHDSIHHGPRP